MQFLLFIPLAVFIIGYSIFANGVVVWHFWDWFLTPVFPALDPLTYLQSIGIAVFLILFKKNPSSIKSELEDTSKAIFYFIFLPWIYLALGWIVHNIIT